MLEGTKHILSQLHPIIIYGTTQFFLSTVEVNAQ